MNPRPSVVSPTILGLLMLVTGCGGGGGGGDEAPAPAPLPAVTVPIKALDEKLGTQPLTVTLSGRLSSGEVITISRSQKRAGQGRFGGVLCQVMQVETATYKNGRVTEVRPSAYFFTLDPFTPIGDSSALGSNTESVTTAIPLPVTASTGESGAYSTDVIYDQGRTQRFGSSVTTWSVEADTATSAWFCVTGVITGTGGNLRSGTSRFCTKTNSAGDLLGYKSDVRVDGVFVSLQSQ